MKKSLANMRDFNSTRRQSYRMKKIAYRVGSCFKGCHNCGETVEAERRGGKSWRKYVTGHDVWRSYDPTQTGWTYWCYECGATDHRAWENAEDIGEQAVRGTADAVAAAKALRRSPTSGKRSKTAAISPNALAALVADVAEFFKKGE